MDGRTFEVTLTRQEGYRILADFHQDGVAPLLMDELPPLGEGAGPAAAEVLAAAVGNCLTASLMFCLTKAHIGVAGVQTTVSGRTVRNEKGRMRIGGLSVRVAPEIAAEDRERAGRCLDLFEDFCIVTQSVRQGIDIEVGVEVPAPA